MQTGFVSGVVFLIETNHIFYTINWNSSRQNRVSLCSIEAEILAAASCVDRSHLFSKGLKIITLPNFFTLTIAVDSLGLHATITTLHEGKDYRLWPTVALMRDGYESKEVDELIWIPGTKNIVDAQTKRNSVMQKRLGKILISGVFQNSIFDALKTS